MVDVAALHLLRRRFTGKDILAYGLLVILVVSGHDGCVSNMLRTGEVAALLGTSRQHVVDLCDRATLPSVRVGTHRRIPQEAVERMMRPGLTREQERSLWLHRALAANLLSDPDAVLSHARNNVARWQPGQRPDGMTARYLDRWKALLDRGVDQVVDVLISARPEACELRQNSPFAGVLAENLRHAVLRSFAEHWSREHEGATS